MCVHIYIYIHTYAYRYTHIGRQHTVCSVTWSTLLTDGFCWGVYPTNLWLNSNPGFCQPPGLFNWERGTTTGIVWRPNGDGGHLGYSGIVSIWKFRSHGWPWLHGIRTVLHITRTPKWGYMIRIMFSWFPGFMGIPLGYNHDDIYIYIRIHI